MAGWEEEGEGEYGTGWEALASAREIWVGEDEIGMLCGVGWFKAGDIRGVDEGVMVVGVRSPIRGDDGLVTQEEEEGRGRHAGG